MHHQLAIAEGIIRLVYINVYGHFPHLLMTHMTTDLFKWKGIDVDPVRVIVVGADLPPGNVDVANDISRYVRRTAVRVGLVEAGTRVFSWGRRDEQPEEEEDRARSSKAIAPDFCNFPLYR